MEFSSNVNNVGNEKRPTVWIQAEEPVLLLLVGHDVDQRRGPFGPVHVLELLQEDLNLLAIGSALSDEMKTAGIFDRGRRLVGVQGVGHCSKSGDIGKGLEVTQVLCCSLS